MAVACGMLAIGTGAPATADIGRWNKPVLSYPVDLTPDGDTFLVTSKAFPELTSFGLDKADALRIAADALDEVLFQRLRRGTPIPRPGHGRWQVRISTQTSSAIIQRWGLPATDMPARRH